MISNNTYSTEPVSLTLPYHFASGGLITNEPFETDLRNRLHDILEQWEIEANESGDPEKIYAMIDQISDAMYPAGDADD